MRDEREAGGIRCGEVLASLSEYLDGSLDAERMARIEAHLRECDLCERFGGTFARTIQGIREILAQPEALDDTVRARLRERLDRER